MSKPIQYRSEAEKYFSSVGWRGLLLLCFYVIFEIQEPQIFHYWLPLAAALTAILLLLRVHFFGLLFIALFAVAILMVFIAGSTPLGFSWDAVPLRIYFVSAILLVFVLLGVRTYAEY